MWDKRTPRPQSYKTLNPKRGFWGNDFRVTIVSCWKLLITIERYERERYIVWHFDSSKKKKMMMMMNSEGEEEFEDDDDDEELQRRRMGLWESLLTYLIDWDCKLNATSGIVHLIISILRYSSPLRATTSKNPKSSFWNGCFLNNCCCRRRRSFFRVLGGKKMIIMKKRLLLESLGRSSRFGSSSISSDKGHMFLGSCDVVGGVFRVGIRTTSNHHDSRSSRRRKLFCCWRCIQTMLLLASFGSKLYEVETEQWNDHTQC